MDENEISKIIFDCAFDLHRKTGPGLLERVYTDSLAYLLTKKGLQVEREKCIPFQFEELHFENAYRLDLLVADKVIIEVKSYNQIMDVHIAQLITYLKLTDKRLGFLINFNTRLLKDGIRRISNNMPF